MFNSEKPSLEALPSTAQLLRSTLIAAVAAFVILITIVLPAEYGKDPTGVGSMLGLTRMGEIKRQLYYESLDDHDDDHDHHDDGDHAALLGIFGVQNAVL